MKFFKCNCKKDTLFSIKGKNLSKDKWHVDFGNEGIWCCVKDKNSDEFIKTILIKESEEDRLEREFFNKEIIRIEKEKIQKNKATKRFNQDLIHLKEYLLVLGSNDIYSEKYNSIGGAVLINPKNIPKHLSINFSVILEVVQSGSGYICLYNLTQDKKVIGSEIYLNSLGYSHRNIKLKINDTFPLEPRLYEARAMIVDGGYLVVKRASINITR